jgi:hypothetical protein
MTDRGGMATVIWAYRDNACRRCYEKTGGQLIAEGFDEDIPDLAYGWPLIKLITLNSDVVEKRAP